VAGVAGLSSRGIFLSYRREDAAPYARLLQFQLRERIPDARVFMDLDSIEPGLDFAEVIREAVDSCAVLVALIGRQWATLTDEEGHRRLDDPDDFVRFEVQAALERGVRLIPVLVDGATPLRRQQLPSELQKLARLNALELSYGRYEYDADRLFSLIQRVLAAASGAGIASQSPLTAVSASTIREAESLPPARGAVILFMPQAQDQFAKLPAEDQQKLMVVFDRILNAVREGVPINDLRYAFNLNSAPNGVHTLRWSKDGRVAFRIESDMDSYYRVRINVLAVSRKRDASGFVGVAWLDPNEGV